MHDASIVVETILHRGTLCFSDFQVNRHTERREKPHVLIYATVNAP